MAFTAKDQAFVESEDGGAAMNELVIGDQILDRVGELMRERGLMGRAFLVSNDRIYPLYGDAVLDGLQKSGFDAAVYRLPDGEPTKSLGQVPVSTREGCATCSPTDHFSAMTW